MGGLVYSYSVLLGLRISEAFNCTYFTGIIDHQSFIWGDLYDKVVAFPYFP